MTVERAGRFALAVLIATMLPASGCQAILGIKDPRPAGGDAAAPPDGASGQMDGQAGNLDASMDAGGALPSLRTGAAMVYDSDRGRLVLFGGSANGTLLNDTWEWDGTRWTNVTPASGNPPPRAEHAMAYDPANQTVVVFGGFDTNQNPLGGTWEWDGSGWTDLTPIGSATYPRARSGGAMAYDPSCQCVVLFGGFNRTDSTSFNDTWEWDGENWMNVTPSSGNPPSRDGGEMAYDADRSRVVLFGGIGVGGSPLGDTWEWDGAAWTDESPASGGPARRNQFAMAYDASSRQVVLFGGWDAGCNPLTDTWGWSAGAWHDETSASGNPPSRGMCHGLAAYAAADDAAAGGVILYGGGPDMWEWNGTSWSAL